MNSPSFRSGRIALCYIRKDQGRSCSKGLLQSQTNLIRREVRLKFFAAKTERISRIVTTEPIHTS